MIFDFVLIIRKDYLIYDVFQLTSRLALKNTWVLFSLVCVSPHWYMLALTGPSACLCD